MSYPSTLYNIIPNSDMEPGIQSDTNAGNTQEAVKMGQKPKTTRRSVACKSCHTLKVKCIPADVNNLGGPCIRCINANRECEIDLNQTRKRRKKGKNDPQGTRSETPVNAEETIARLQEQVRMLQAQIDDSNLRHRSNTNVMNTPDFQSSPFVSRSDLENEIITLCESSDSKLTDLTNTLSLTATERINLLQRNQPVDVIGRGLLDIEEARERLDIYRNEIYKAHPLIEVPANLSVEDMQKSQPLLFNAIMSVTNALIVRHPNETDAKVQEKALQIDNLAIMTISEEILAVGTKSEELIKSLLLLCLWYNAPELFRNRRYHLLNTLAVSLLHDIGIGGKPSFSFKKNAGVISQDTEEYNNLEYRNLVMVLYVTTVSICLILRRSIYVKWTPYVEDCCQILQTCNVPEYQKLALFSRLSHELERVHIIHTPDVSDKQGAPSYYVIRELQKKLVWIKNTIDPEDNAFLVYYYSVEAYLHEPILSEIFCKDPLESKEYKLTDSAVKSISRCTNSCLNSLDEYNKMSPKTIAKLPLVYSSRIIYTVGMLLRIRYLILSLPSDIEKDLVPRHAVFAIQKLARLIDQASNIYRVNHFLKKTRLILQLFIQTYATQVKELLKANGNEPNDHKFPPVSKKEYTQLVKLNKLFSDQGIQNKLDGTSKPYPQLPLDMLSYAASYKNGDKSDSYGKRNQENINHINTSSSIQSDSYPLSEDNVTYKKDQPEFDTLTRTHSIASNPISMTYKANTNYSENEKLINNQIQPSLNENTLNPAYQSYLAKPDQLENSYLALNDEFWTDLFNANTYPINFSNTNTTSDYNDEVFFMN